MRLVLRSGICPALLAASWVWAGSAFPSPAWEGVTVLGRGDSPPFEGHVLDLAFLGGDRLVVLTRDSVVLCRREGLLLKPQTQQTLPGPFSTVRAPAGVLRVTETEGAFWIASNLLPQAILIHVDGFRMKEAQRAAALPGGDSYRPGTNLIQAGGGAYARVVSGDPALVVSAEGRLGTLQREGPRWLPVRVGYAAAWLWPGMLAASSPRPPGADDGLLLFDLRSEARPLGSLPLDGTLVSLAARRQGETTLVAAALANGEGRTRVLLLELAPDAP